MWFWKIYTYLYFKYVIRILNNSNILCLMDFNIYINNFLEYAK